MSKSKEAYLLGDIEIFEIPLLSPLLEGITNKLPNWPITVYLSEEAILGSQK